VSHPNLTSIAQISLWRSWRLFLFSIAISSPAMAETSQAPAPTYDKLSYSFSEAVKKIRHDPGNAKAAEDYQAIYNSTPEPWRLQLIFDSHIAQDSGFFSAGLRSILELLAAGQVPDHPLKERLANAIWKKWRQLPSTSSERKLISYTAPAILMLLQDDRGLEIELERGRTYTSDGWTADSPLEKFVSLKEKYDELVAQRRRDGKINKYEPEPVSAAMYDLCIKRKANGAATIESRSKETHIPAKIFADAEHLAAISRSAENFDDRAANDRFMELLSTLGHESNDAAEVWAATNEGKLISAKMILIARDYQRRPEIYREVIDTFFIDKNDSTVKAMVTSPISPSGAQLTDQYRLPFEMALLAPPGYWAEYNRTPEVAVETLARIGNKKSLLTFKHLFAGEVMPEALIMGLVKIPSRETLFVLLDALALQADSDRASLRMPPQATFPRERTIKLIDRLLSWTSNEDKLVIWKELVANVSPESLEEHQKDAFAALQATILTADEKVAARKSKAK
jgi:hypothetical protein